MKTDCILAEFRQPVHAPDYWEGHTICYKEYPVPGGIGLGTLNLCARDGGRQRSAPWRIAQPITVIVGGKRMSGEVYHVDIHRPGWESPDRDAFDPLLAEWVVTVCFPRIPKDHLRLP